jgi:hypothetical protein
MIEFDHTNHEDGRATALGVAVTVFESVDVRAEVNYTHNRGRQTDIVRYN